MTDRKTLDKYIDLGNSCLSKEEKVKVMDMLYRYREAFSLRDEISTCPNIEIDVTDKSPFFVRPYHVREEDKAFIDKLVNFIELNISPTSLLHFSSALQMFASDMLLLKLI